MPRVYASERGEPFGRRRHTLVARRERQPDVLGMMLAVKVTGAGEDPDVREAREAVPAIPSTSGCRSRRATSVSRQRPNGSARSES